MLEPVHKSISGITGHWELHSSAYIYHLSDKKLVRHAGVCQRPHAMTLCLVAFGNFTVICHAKGLFVPQSKVCVVSEQV